jgi:hypothetical protein
LPRKPGQLACRAVTARQPRHGGACCTWCGACSRHEHTSRRRPRPSPVPPPSPAPGPIAAGAQERIGDGLRGVLLQVPRIQPAGASGTNYERGRAGRAHAGTCPGRVEAGALPASRSQIGSIWRCEPSLGTLERTRRFDVSALPGAPHLRVACTGPGEAPPRRSNAAASPARVREERDREGHLPAAGRRGRSAFQRRARRDQSRAGGSAVGGEVAEAAGHLARPYDVSLRLEQRLRRGQVVSLPWGVAEYLLDIGGGEVGPACNPPPRLPGRPGPRSTARARGPGMRAHTPRQGGRRFRLSCKTRHEPCQASSRPRSASAGALL